MHPGIDDAKKQLKYLSSRDRQEILRISRMESDENVFQGRKWSPRYTKMWEAWQASKGPDLTIVFE